MVDFFLISTRATKRGVIEIYPKFIVKKSLDLMIRGGDFYAIWLDNLNRWSTDEDDAIKLIDHELDLYAEEHRSKFDADIRVLHLWDAETGMIDRWHKYCHLQMPENYHMLDEKLIFTNTKAKKEDYASKSLSYPLENTSIEAYNQLISTLYSPEERHKIEWSIGSIVSGDSKELQKFVVLYGAAGTGKSTILNIIQKLFDGYYCVFDAKALGSSNSTFALESFKDNPLVAIQHDGDLSRIEDNTRLNSLVSHEWMTVNEKFKSTYTNRFKCFLFMGTNKPVKITDARSGLLRRLIDVSPSGKKIGIKEYNRLIKQINFELGGIAKYCYNIYMQDPNYYDDYIPTTMFGASNDFYNYIIDSYHIFKKEDGVTMKSAWEMYKNYCEDARVLYPLSQRVFKEELKNYFSEYKERYITDDGSRVRSYYKGFQTDKFEDLPVKDINDYGYSIDFKDQHSIFDEYCKDCPAQYANKKGLPIKKWDDIETTLKDLDTSKLHYVRVPENHIIIDFDIPDENGNKSFERNLEEANKFPRTYAEVSKSGGGIHLHYIYAGDISKLSRVYSEHIEIKIYTGNSALRRKRTLCNDIPIATISSGLPTKGDDKIIDSNNIKNEQHLINLIEKNLRKEILGSTASSISFIYKLLDEAYNSNITYDVTPLRPRILAFAANSTNQSSKCIKMVNSMKFKSSDEDGTPEINDKPIAFYDIEVFPNLLLVNWKVYKKSKITRMINPRPEDIDALISNYRLVGYNCRRYDNHILYARLMGYDNEQLFNLSQKIINQSSNCFFGEAWNISYTDVYDFASSSNKMSLKKLMIKMNIHHQELGLPWDKPVPENMWNKVSEYCDNDVIATEAAFDYLSADWTARIILADLANGSVNDTTNSLTTKIIFGKERAPQKEFFYRDLSKPVYDIDMQQYDFLTYAVPDMMKHTHGDKNSLLPYFEGYKYEFGKSTYMGEEVGEGGYVYAEPGMYTDIALLDISSMHPHSVIAEMLFGEYTKRFKELVDARVLIKHEDFDRASKILNGKLIPYIEKIKKGEITSKDLANALKTAINSVYGLTSAKFENPFNDIRNIDNIVAKRGALFMINLKHEVYKQGYTVAHIKTDSIKIPNATPEIINFVMEYGKDYGYYFEHEATYEKMCLVNDAVYIAKYADKDWCDKHYKYVPKDNQEKSGKWTATGTQFQVPYVFKTLFSKEKIVFDDVCETKSVTTELYLDKNEGYPDVSKYEKELSDLKTSLRKGVISEDVFNKKAEELNNEIAKGHNYIFVGRVGQFTPVMPGSGGGWLMRKKDDNYYFATGAKGFRWVESEDLRNEKYDTKYPEMVDILYYTQLVDKAADEITKYVDLDWFRE